MLSESLEFKVARRIEAVHSLDETDRTGRDQIVELDLRATPMQAPGEQFDLRNVGENQLFAIGCGQHGEIVPDPDGRPLMRRPLRWSPASAPGRAGRCKKLYRTLDELQMDVDQWIKHYNEDRPHSGKYCFGKTPMQTFLDSRHLADEKMLDQLTPATASDTIAGRAEPETQRSPAQRSEGGGGERFSAA